ncbi:YcjF family protein [Rubellimicrobium aerolatum]|uniref:YcjF family protein n=1 Tax=Rubellimicrobium aerolatum TaxID=490979 RepID=A0ABW0SFU8_9RHOB|nr:TIGR01620 family protein [Rubellimicrobium aerolatum]MBP1805814.1 putative membrane protein [Rubellimicrobium aerolatum]
MTDPIRPRGPVLIEVGDAAPPAPEAAPPVPEVGTPVPAMERAMRIAARPRSGLAAWFWSLLGSFLLFALSVAAWDWVTSLLERHPVLGGIASALLLGLCVVALAIAGRELLAIRRLARIDHVQREAVAALASGSLSQARTVTADLLRVYAGREGLGAASDRLRERQGDVFDADGLLRLAERELLGPLDAAAEREVAGAARQVAAVTAVVPLPLADVAAALASNLRMIRRIAEVYGGRSGTLGSWRLVRGVMTHLVATGAVAVGDDLIHGVAGGTVLARLSRRFGEGVVNGALTARVGIAAIEVCRPLPFLGREGPSVTGILGGALRGLFGDRGSDKD